MQMKKPFFPRIMQKQDNAPVTCSIKEKWFIYKSR